MKNGYEATRRVVEKFVDLGVNHMVVGGLSSNAYGIRTPKFESLRDVTT